MLRTATPPALALLLAVATAGTSFAQDSVAVKANVLFYGDNTEFHNPFREGETIFGAVARVTVATALGDRTVLTLGAVGNQRFGSEDAFDLVRPVISLTVRGSRSSFIFGTFAPSDHAAAHGPDLNGLHGLLPPLQRETLAFDRPSQAGLQWLFAGGRLRHDLWLNWQRLNTPEHRERLDAGANAHLRLGGPFSLPIQLHLVHEGGQLFSAGPVADSLAAAAGVSLRGRLARFDTAAIEAFALASRFIPDRSDDERDLDGGGFLARASAERAGWRGHLLVWRGKHFITDEGDPNYLSVRRSGSRYRGTRDYSEAGLTRIFRPDSRVTIHASGRIHRVERHYEYSYRILGVVDAAWKVR
jgi:hypothetical protein